MRLFSPAKLNLFFRVLKKRPDGYHEIESLYQAIDLGDYLTFSIGKEQLTCTDPTLPCDQSNLILKAANLFRKKSGLEFGLQVHLEKNIPIQAGLGGGSSNAATTLWALNVLTGANVGVEKLKEWGAELGSDVSFFFSGGTAFCRGRGEIIEEMEPLPRLQGYLAKPPVGLSTPAVYQRVALPLPLSDQAFFNDLEPAAFSLMPELAELKDALYGMGFEQVTMTGSGTAFFCQGNVADPVLDGVRFIPVKAIQRSDWY